MSLGDEIRTRREALGLTLDGLAQRSGLSPHYLSTLENNKRDPHVSTLLAVAKALRVAPGELLGTSQSGAELSPTLGALYERAPVEAQEAVTTLLRLAVGLRRRAPNKKRK
jgi:transcriptional regulator with XRE-family HTH domain